MINNAFVDWNMGKLIRTVAETLMTSRLGVTQLSVVWEEEK